MGIKSTRRITREQAINRIKEVAELLKDENFHELEKITNESENFSYDSFLKDISNKDDIIRLLNLDFNKATNKHIEDIIDSPVYRFSMFENYIIEG